VVSHGRLKSHYQALNTLLAKNNSSLCVRTRVRPYGSRISALQARHRITWLETCEIKERQHTMIGRLVGGSLEYNRFELEVDDGMIAGRLAPSARAELQALHLGDEVEARIMEQTSTATSGTHTSSSYLLLGLVPRSGEGLLFKAESPAAPQA
jgi:hypothetical protein